MKCGTKMQLTDAVQWRPVTTTLLYISHHVMQTVKYMTTDGL